MDDAVNAVEGASEPVGIAHVPDDFFHVGAQVGGPAVGMDPLLERVEDADLVAALQQDVGRVRADEAGAARDQNTLQGGSSPGEFDVQKSRQIYIPPRVTATHGAVDESTRDR